VDDLVGRRTLGTLLEEQILERPDAPWLEWEGRTGDTGAWTFREFGAAVDRLAGGLAGIGVRKGTAVVIHLRNCPELVVATFALARLGAVIVPNIVANLAAETEHVVGFSDAEVLLTSAAHTALFEEVLPATPAVRAVVVTSRDGAPPPELACRPVQAYDDLAAAEPPAAWPDVASEDLAEMIFTSGTTARPKAVMLTHANLLWAGERSVRDFLMRPDDRLLTVMPLFHGNAQALALMPALTVGATLVLLEEYRATRFWGQVRAHRATVTGLVAMLLRTLMAQPPDPADREHVLRVVNYAINVPAAEKDAFQERFGVELANGYGLSEAMLVVSHAPLHRPKRWPSVGLPCAERLVRIVGDDGAEVPSGEVGEITVHGVPGRTLMAGYYKDPEATAAAIRDGWLHTGDHGFTDELGYLYFFDRKKDVIKRAGENVSAMEVETTLLEHPEIALAAVIAVPDPIRDEAVKAFVVRREGSRLDAEEIRAFCAQRLASFKVPGIVELRASLPQTSVGKIEKRLLRAEEEAARA
jgi:crotonobetaine/carnitine-CoA ligase